MMDETLAYVAADIIAGLAPGPITFGHTNQGTPITASPEFLRSAFYFQPPEDGRRVRVPGVDDLLLPGGA